MTATITLRTQSSGVRPQFEHAVASLRSALQTTGAFRQVREKNERELRSFRLEWPSATEGQKHLLEEAWSDSYGGVLPMNYTMLGDVDANAIEVRFVESTLRIERVGVRTWSMDVEVREVHA